MRIQRRGQTSQNCYGEKLASEATLIRAKYGPRIGSNELTRILQDRSCVRYPCEIAFASNPLLPGEFAHPAAKGTTPTEGYTLYLHPMLESDPVSLPYAVLSLIPQINYGAAVSPEEAEVFGSSALGMSKEEYFRALCELSDRVGGDELC